MDGPERIPNDQERDVHPLGVPQDLLGLALDHLPRRADHPAPIERFLSRPNANPISSISTRHHREGVERRG